MKTNQKEVSIWIDKQKTKNVNKWLLTAYLTLQIAATIWTLFQDNPNVSWNSSWDDARENRKELRESKFHIEKTNNDFPMNYLYPANVVAEWPKRVAQREEILEVPYWIAHNFDVATALNNKNYTVADSIVQAEIKKTILEDIVWFNFVKKEWLEQSKPDTLSTEVVLDSVGWYSSPEAAKYWDKSLIPWNKEKENINLAKNIRGDDARSRILRAFNDIMIQHPDLANRIDTTSVKIVWDELQLKDMQEYKELANMAVRLGYPSIVDMLSAYNSGKLKSKWDIARIDDLIWSKRKIMLAFTLKNDEKTVIIFPVFLPILLLIPFVRIIKPPKKHGWETYRNRPYILGKKPQKWYQKPAESNKEPRLTRGANHDASLRWDRSKESRTGRK